VSGREGYYPATIQQKAAPIERTPLVPFTPGLTGKLIFIYTRTGEGQGLDYFGHHVDKCEKIPLDSGERSKHEKRLRRSDYYF
jgi:hypothetical protein